MPRVSFSRTACSRVFGTIYDRSTSDHVVRRRLRVAGCSVGAALMPRYGMANEWAKNAFARAAFAAITVINVLFKATSRRRRRERPGPGADHVASFWARRD